MPDVWDRLKEMVTPVDKFNPDTHIYTRDGVEIIGVSEVMKSVGLQDYSQVPIGVLEAAASRGTAVHLATALLDQDNLDWDSLDDSIRGYVASYQRWKDAAKPIYVAIEEWQIMQCAGMNYGGTIDRIGEHDYCDWVFDIKTSSKKAAWWACQTAAYDEHQDKRRGVIHCFKTGEPAKLIEYKDDTDYLVWESALRVATWKRER